MNKWYIQIAVGLVTLVLIAILNEAIYPMDLFPTKEDILRHGDPTAFYIMAVLGLAAQILMLVGLVRGIIAMIKAFRGFVRINK